MHTALIVADVCVVLAIVASVVRAVWKGQPPSFGSLLLSACIALASLVFAMVSLSAASSLLAASSSAARAAIGTFIIVAAVVLGAWWTKSPAR